MNCKRYKLQIPSKHIGFNVLTWIRAHTATMWIIHYTLSNVIIEQIMDVHWLFVLVLLTVCYLQISYDSMSFMTRWKATTIAILIPPEWHQHLFDAQKNLLFKIPWCEFVSECKLKQIIQVCHLLNHVYKCTRWSSPAVWNMASFGIMIIIIA